MNALTARMCSRLAFIIVLWTAPLSAIGGEPPLPIRSITLEPAFNVKDARILVGTAHNVFLGRVIRTLGLATNTPTSNPPYPRTLFEVEVIANVKGNLSGSVLLRQIGGARDGYYIRVQSDNPLDPDAAGLLNEGAAYLFVTGHSPSAPANLHDVSTYSTGRILITATARTLSKEEIIALATPSLPS